MTIIFCHFVRRENPDRTASLRLFNDGGHCSPPLLPEMTKFKTLVWSRQYTQMYLPVKGKKSDRVSVKSSVLNGLRYVGLAEIPLVLKVRDGSGHLQDFGVGPRAQTKPVNRHLNQFL